MKVIVTGATGLVGRNLAESLHVAGTEVLATGRATEVGRELQAQGIAFRRADLLDAAQSESALSPADCVVHCAAKTGDWGTAAEFDEWFGKTLEILDRPFRPRRIPAKVALLTAGVMELAGHLPFGPERPALTRFSVGCMARSMTLSIDKAHRRLGFSPRVGNRATFEKLARWHAADRSRGACCGER